MKLLRTVLVCSLLLACGGDDDDTDTDAAGIDASSGRRLVILATNDEHSHLFGFGPEIDDFPAHTEPGNGDIVGSAARRATVLEQERAAAAAAGYDTLTVSSGDQNFGALPQVGFDRSAPDFQAMQALGYDVMCPGNHEFDRGPGTYAAAILAANANGGIPQIVSSNIRFDADDSGDDALAQLFGEGDSSRQIKRYHVIRTPSGIKVGFVGIMGAGAAALAGAKGPVLFSGNADEEADTAAVLEKIYDDIQPIVDTLRNDEGVDVVIALSHSGMRPVPEAGDDFSIASNVTGIDVIVSGHTHTEFRKNVEAPDGHIVLVMESGRFGEYVGRIELTVPAEGRPIVDEDATRLIPIDDTIVPDLSAVGAVLDAVIEDLEVPQDGETESFLEAALSRIEGAVVNDDPKVLGDLYYRELATTTFDVIFGYKHTETNILNLSTDAMMSIAEDLEGPTTFAVQAWGNTRGDILAGQTGALSFGDLFRVLPLGEDPVDGSAGYPLALVYLSLVELKGGFDATTADFGLFSGSFYVTLAGGGFDFDTSRDPIDLSSPIEVLNPDNGRITQIWIDTDHTDGSWNDRDVAIFDVDRDAGQEWISSAGGATTLYPVVASLLVIERVAAGGLTPKFADGTPIDNIADAYITRPDGSVVKDYEAFMQYIRDESAANGGLLPSRYDENTVEGAIPRRVICTGPECP